MASTINGTSTGNGGLISTGDDSGILNIQTNETTAITVDASQRVGIGTASPSALLHVSSTSAETLRFQSTSSAPYQSFYNSSANRAGYMEWNTSAFKIDAESGASSTIAFLTANTERMRIDSSGNLLVGGTTQRDSAKITNEFNGGNGISVYCVQNTNAVDFAVFRANAGALCGNISRVGTTNAVTYASASDYRLKENIAQMTGALEKVAQLKPVTYNWKNGGEAADGFIAHELAEVCPSAVVGEKDAVDADGNPKYQSIDTSFLVATLTAAIQEAKALIDTQAETINALTARVVALEQK